MLALNRVNEVSICFSLPTLFCIGNKGVILGRFIMHFISRKREYCFIIR